MALFVKKRKVFLQFEVEVLKNHLFGEYEK